MITRLPLELKIKAVDRILPVIVSLVCGFFLLVMRFGADALHSPRFFSAPSLLIVSIFVAIVAWGVYLTCLANRQLKSLYIYVGEDKIVVNTRQGNTTLKWEDVHSLTGELKSVDGKAGSWTSLRGKDGQVLAQWDKIWLPRVRIYRYLAADITDVIRERLTEREAQFQTQSKWEIWKQANLGQAGMPLQARVSYLLLGIGLLVICLGGAIYASNFPPPVSWLSVILPLIGTVCLVGGAMESTLIVDEETIEVKSRLGHWKMNWDEVAEVGIDRHQTSLTFHGHDGQKQIVFRGPQVWKKGAGKMMWFLEAYCEKRGIFFERRAPLQRGRSRGVRFMKQK